MTLNSALHYVDLKPGLRMAFTDSGGAEKPCILMIHGLANYHGVWKWTIPDLQLKYRCIAIDLPGSGYSSRGEYPYGLSFYVFVLLEFIKELKLDKVYLMGHSMGGQIALQTAIHHPEVVRGLLLFAPAGIEYFSPAEATLFKSAIALGNFLAMDETHIAQSINASFYRHPHIARQLISELNQFIRENNRASYRNMLEQSIHSMLDTPTATWLKQIHCPLYVVFGEKDQLIPNRYFHPVPVATLVTEALQGIAGSVWHCIPEAGHFVQIEQAAVVNASMLHFLEGHR